MQDQIGNYDIQRTIGQGGMGEVYLGIHRMLCVPAAVKVLQPQYARVPEMVERFLREAKAASRVEHPGIVKILDCGFTRQRQPYLAMEYLEGQTLADYLQVCGRLALSEALCISKQLALALAAAHDKQVIHRDLKPENIIRLAPPADDKLGQARIKIVDFGIARIVDKDRDASESESEGGLADSGQTRRRRLTMQGDLLGTPSYMAPEMVSDARLAVDRSDVYALGVIIYQMLVGEPPFTSTTLGGILFKQMDAPAPALTQHVRAIPPALCTLVQQMMAKAPEQRPAMRAVSEELGKIEASLRRPKRRSVLRPETLQWSGRSQTALEWVACSFLVFAMGISAPHSQRHFLTSQLAPMPAEKAVEKPAAPAPVVAKAAAVASPTPQLQPPSPSLPSLPIPVEPPQPSPGLAPSLASRPRSPVVSIAPPRRSALEAARQAYQEKRYDAALSSARLAIKEQPYSAWQLIGQAGCMKADLQVIKEAMYRLDAPHQSNVLFACQSRNIDLGNL